MSRDFFRNNEMRLSDLQLCLCSGAPPAIGGTNITPWFLTQNFLIPQLFSENWQEKAAD